MHLINNEIIRNTNREQTPIQKQLYKYKFYNLLFSGKINMKEYLDALTYVGDNKGE